MMPKVNAVRRPGRLRVTYTPGIRFAGRVALTLGAAFVVSCNETTAPLLRYPLLDEVGTSNWTAVSVGGEHSCGLKVDGTAYCWGSNRFGQLGVFETDTTCGTGSGVAACALRPVAVQTTVKFLSISAGQRHTCGITTDREAYCWGANDENQLAAFGLGGPTLMRVPGTLPWTQISAGYTHSCAVRSDGALYCWGQNERGQLGNNSVFTSSTPVAVQLSSPIAAVSTGQARTCARTTAGIVYCWGAIWVVRQEGLELSRTQPVPELVPDAPAMAWLSVGSFTTCGADISGFAYCWEANPRGTIGDGSLDGSTTPRRVGSDLEFVQLSAGLAQTCGVTIAGAGFCWGDDTFGQLGVPATSIGRCGDNAHPCSLTPTPVLGRQSFTEIATGLGSHTCGVTTRGNLYCWGLGTSGQRGDGTTRQAVSTPLTIVEPH